MQKSYVKNIFSTVVFGLALSSAPLCRASHDPFESVAAAALTVGTALITGYGIYKLCDWAFSRTDEQVIADVEQHLRRAHLDFDRGLSIVERGPHGMQDNSIDHYPALWHASMYSLEEPILYELASMNLQSTTCASYTSSLSSLIDLLVSEHATLNSRLSALSETMRVQDCDLQRTYTHMNNLVGQVSCLLGRLRFLKEYMLDRYSYFSLYECEASLLGRYDQEIIAHDKYSYDLYALTHLVRACVLRSHVHDSYAYPYMAYVKKIQADLSRLNDQMAKCGYEYINRLQAAHELYDKLAKISSIVISDPSYNAEIRAYEIAERERQRLELERMKIAALQHQAWQLRQQNNELRKSNELKQQELRNYNSCSLCNDGLWIVDNFCTECYRCPTSINLQFTL